MNHSGFVAEFNQASLLGSMALDPVIDHPGGGGGGSVDTIGRPPKPGPVIDHPGGGTVKETLMHTTSDSNGTDATDTPAATKWSVPRRNMWILLGVGIVSLIFFHKLQKR